MKTEIPDDIIQKAIRIAKIASEVSIKPNIAICHDGKSFRFYSEDAWEDKHGGMFPYSKPTHQPIVIITPNGEIKDVN